MIKEKIIVVTEKTPVRLTTISGQNPRERTCIYVSLSSNGKLIIAGGSSIIERIEGVGMRGKVVR